MDPARRQQLRQIPRLAAAQASARLYPTPAAGHQPGGTTGRGLIPGDWDWFPVRITAVTGAAYEFVELWLDETGAYADKPTGRVNSSADYGYSMGGALGVDDIAIARRGPGAGGYAWELIPVYGGVCDGSGDGPNCLTPVSVVTDACLDDTGSGGAAVLKLTRQLLYVPASWLSGDPFCEVKADCSTDSGPCGDGTTGPPVTVDCCPSPVPRRLWVCVSSTGAGCASGVYPIDYISDSTPPTWTGSIGNGCVPYLQFPGEITYGYLRLWCDDGDWFIDVTWSDSSSWVGATLSGDCAPLAVSGTDTEDTNNMPITDPGYTSAGVVTFAVTEDEPTDCIGGGATENPCTDLLVSHPDLEVTITGGTEAGVYTAAWSGSAWTFTTAGSSPTAVSVIYEATSPGWLEMDAGVTYATESLACDETTLTAAWSAAGASAMFGATAVGASLA